MRHRPRFLALLLAATALGLVGCGHTDTSVFPLRAKAPPRPSAVLFLADRPGPTRPYIEIAIVQAVGFGSDANAEDVARALTEKARELGCDAVARVAIDVGYMRAHGAGVCLRYTDGS